MKEHQIDMKQVFYSILLILILCILDHSCNIEKLQVFNTYEEGKKIAFEKNKSIFLIFDVYTNPNRYIDHLLEDRDIKFYLKEYVIIRLMCDSKEKVDKKVTRGEINSRFQVELTSENFQPMFVKLNSSGVLISEPLGYSKKWKVIEYIKTK